MVPYERLAPTEGYEIANYWLEEDIVPEEEGNGTVANETNIRRYLQEETNNSTEEENKQEETKEE